MLTSTAFMLSLSISSIIGYTKATEAGARSAHADDVIRARGFMVEPHTIYTVADIPLTLHRIINPLANPDTLNKYPVLYGHGVLYDSQSMISRSEHSRPRKPVIGQPTIKYSDANDPSDDNSLPFMYSNNNFDVWMYDARGTNDENRNITTETNPLISQKFWDFSLDDEALVDLPKLIEYVLFKTASKKVVYTGYSESTFFMFALLSTRPEYADKVAAFVAMAPVAYVAHIRGMTLPALAGISSVVPEFVNYAILPQPIIDTLDLSLRNLCQPGLSKLLCKPIVDGIGGTSAGEIAPNFFNNFFKSTSVKAVKHFLQLFVSKRFCMYDYGEASNMRIYGSRVPPSYHLSNVKSDRIILVRGLADFLSTSQDQSTLINELGTKPYRDFVIPNYNHFDFIDGKDIIRVANGPVMIAVYELLYKDGPNILKDQNQIQATRNMRAPVAVAKTGVEKQKPKTPNGLGILESPLLERLTGAAGIFNKNFLAPALGRK